MSKPLITVDGETLVHAAMNLMAEKEISALVVTEKDKPVGIVTERDVLNKCCSKASCNGTKIREIMSEPLIIVDADTPVDVAIETMTDQKVRRLLVAEGEKIVGIVTTSVFWRSWLAKRSSER